MPYSLSIEGEEQLVGEKLKVALLVVVEFLQGTIWGDTIWGDQNVQQFSGIFGMSIHNMVGSIRQLFNIFICPYHGWWSFLAWPVARYNWRVVKLNHQLEMVHYVFSYHRKLIVSVSCFWNIAFILSCTCRSQIWCINTWWTDIDWATTKHNVNWKSGLSVTNIESKGVYPAVGCTLQLSSMLIWQFLTRMYHN